MITDKQIKTALGRLYSTYPNVSLTPQAIEEWLCIFEQYEIDQFETAFRAAQFESGGFPPSAGMVMKEMRAIIKDAPAQSMTWKDDESSGISYQKIDTKSLDERGKEVTNSQTYLDMTTTAKWEQRKKYFAQGLWLVIEKIEGKKARTSYVKWKHGQNSSIYREGGNHVFNNETLPFLELMN